MEYKPHIAEYKRGIVKQIVDLINQYPIMGAVNMENLPAQQLQIMRAKLRDKIVMVMTKRRLMKIAIEQCKEKKRGIEKIEEHLKGMPALIFTKENPFALFKNLKKSKSKAPAKAGQIAPRDIVVTAGPTPFAPGPIIGELAQAGIKSGVEGGKVAIREDSVVAIEGEKIKPKVAEILTRLNIKPMEVGLDLVATYEDGVIYTKKILDIDEDKFMHDLQKAASSAINLSVFAGYATKGNIKIMIGKAFNDAKAIGLERNIIDEGIIEELLGKAERSMLSLKNSANIQVQERAVVREIKKEEPKEETVDIEKKEEGALEKEKEIIKEEQKIEKEAKQKEKKEAPVEKEVEEAVKEEEEKELEKERIEEEKEIEELEKRKSEEAKKKAEEERKRQEELKRIEEERKRKEAEELKRRGEEQEKRKAEELKRIEEGQKEKEEIQKLEETKNETEKKVSEMVGRVRMHVGGKEPTAEMLVEETRAEGKKEIQKPAMREKTASELLGALQKKGTLRGEAATTIKPLEEKKKETDEEKWKKKEKELKEAEDLAQELVRKGTLRR
ncbi:50S ribosomal protein L10 [Candidatus Woesearchaeota archaeon]|nr:50S ribosomal protein L10 [Candidatus Woesearchaeota archaeon]